MTGTRSSMPSPCFPPTDPCSDVPFPSAGFVRCVPRVRRYCEDVPTSARPSDHPSVSPMALPPLRSPFAPAGRERPTDRPGGFGFGTPAKPILRRWRRTDLSGSWRTLVDVCRLLRPRRDHRPRPLRDDGTAPALFDAEGSPREKAFRGSMGRPSSWLSTLRRYGRPYSTQDSLPAAGHALPGGIGYPQGSNERFPVALHPFPLSQALPDATKTRSPPISVRLTD